MPLKRLKNDHRVTTWRGVELWMADEAGSLVFCRISHEALRDQAKRTHFDVRISITENQSRYIVIGRRRSNP